MGDDVREPSFQAAQRFLVTLSIGSFPLVISAAGRVPSYLGDGHGVQTVVQLPVPSTREPMSNDIARGHLYRRGSGVTGKRGGRSEPTDRPDPTRPDPTRARILPAVSVPIPHSSVRALPDSVTACSMSLADLRMRRSNCRTSPMRSTARLRSVLPAMSRGRVVRRSRAARSTVRPRGAPAGTRCVSTTWSRWALTLVLRHAETSTCWGSEMIFSHVTKELLGGVPAPGRRVVRVHTRRDDPRDRR